MYKIKLTNIFEDAYNQQHKDGFLSQLDIEGDEYSDPNSDAIFDTKEAAEEALESVKGQFNDSPDLEIVEV